MDETQSETVVIESAVPTRLGRAGWLSRVGMMVLVAVLVVLAGRMGVRFRRVMWDVTSPIRATGDMDRMLGWGRRAAGEGYLNQYEKMRGQQPGDGDWLDYPPLRLAVVTLWGRWSQQHFPQVKAWHTDRSFALAQPMLRFNLFMECFGVVSAFLLVRLWVVRGSVAALSDRTLLRGQFRGWAAGLWAAALLWFNPAVVLSGYGWPSADGWVISIFLLAALLASVEWWFSAGVALGVGMMLKTQMVVALPLFVAWPIVLGRPMSAVRVCGGFVLAVGLVLLPWMVSYLPPDRLAAAQAVQARYKQVVQVPTGTFAIVRTVDVPAIIWVMGCVCASIGLPFVAWLVWETDSKNADAPAWKKLPESAWFWRIVAGFGALVLVYWPWLLKRNHSDWLTGFACALGLITAILFIRPRGISYLTATTLGIALLLCMSIFRGSTAWYECSVNFPMVHRPTLTVGLTDNFPGILEDNFRWSRSRVNEVFFTVPAHTIWHWPAAAFDVTVRQFLIRLFSLCVILSAIGAGLHARFKDTRILIAMVAPWVAFFCFLPQMNERYLLYAAGISSICTGASVGMTLLGIVLSGVTFVMMLLAMLVSAQAPERTEFGRQLTKLTSGYFDENSGNKLWELLNQTHPDLSYAVVLCGLIFIYFSIAPRWSRARLPGRNASAGTWISTISQRIRSWNSPRADRPLDSTVDARPAVIASEAY